MYRAQGEGGGSTPACNVEWKVQLSNSSPYVLVNVDDNEEKKKEEEEEMCPISCQSTRDAKVENRTVGRGGMDANDESSTDDGSNIATEIQRTKDQCIKFASVVCSRIYKV